MEFPLRFTATAIVTRDPLSVEVTSSTSLIPFFATTLVFGQLLLQPCPRFKHLGTEICAYYKF